MQKWRFCSKSEFLILFFMFCFGYTPSAHQALGAVSGIKVKGQSGCFWHPVPIDGRHRGASSCRQILP